MMIGPEPMIRIFFMSVLLGIATPFGSVTECWDSRAWNKGNCRGVAFFAVAQDLVGQSDSCQFAEI
jgi:hypothetical protein